MHWCLLLCSVPSPCWSRHCLCRTVSECTSHPKKPTRSWDFKVALWWPFYCLSQKLFWDLSGLSMRCRLVSAYAHPLIHYSRTSCVHLHPDIFDTHFAAWIRIHLRILWKNFAFPEPRKPVKIHTPILLAIFRMWNPSSCCLLHHYICHPHQEGAFQKHRSCAEDSEVMVLAKLLHDIRLSVLVCDFNHCLVLKYLLFVNFARQKGQPALHRFQNHVFDYHRGNSMDSWRYGGCCWLYLPVGGYSLVLQQIKYENYLSINSWSAMSTFRNHSVRGYKRLHSWGN